MNDQSYDEKFWRVLVNEQLVDLSQYHKANFFEEVPLYSRDSDLGFLSEFDSSQANSILLGFSLRFLNAVIAYEIPRSSYFAAITIWEDSESDLIVPNLFAWSGPTQKLKRQLILGTVATPFGKRIKQTVATLGLGGKFGILEEAGASDSGCRLFISPSHAPYHRFVTLDQFRGRPSLRS